MEVRREEACVGALNISQPSGQPPHSVLTKKKKKIMTKLIFLYQHKTVPSCFNNHLQANY